MNRPHILNPWLWKMAWRDSRTHRQRLMLFVASIVLGIAALVAISSLGDNLEDAINNQGKSLLGADLALLSNQPFSDDAEAFLDSIPGEQAREAMFASMAVFPRNGDTRLCLIVGLEGRYPFYGDLQTTPHSAVESWRKGGGALVDQNLTIQYNLAIGDTIGIGAGRYPVVGSLEETPGQAAAGTLLAPRIYLSMSDVESTGLIRFGSRVNWRAYYKLPASIETDLLNEQLEHRYSQFRLTSTTAADSQARVGSVMANLFRFLNLVAFVALLLGSIGVASAVHVYVRQKLTSTAILRCVGAQIHQTITIYLIQTGVMGVLGSIAGATLGVLVQVYLPRLLEDFLVVDVDFTISWPAVLKGVVVGVGMTVLFTLLPLISLRRVTPLIALRSSVDESDLAAKDPLRWVIYVLILAALTAFAILQSAVWYHGLLFMSGVIAAFGILTGIARTMMHLVKRFFPGALSYIWRQSLANLFRPNNQTLVLMLSIGLGTFLIATLYLTQNSLLNQVQAVGGGSQPNMILFDIQVDQVDGVQSLLKTRQLPVIQTTPIVTARLKKLKGRTVQEIQDDSTSKISHRSLVWEFRTTYRDTLNDTEEIVDGKWIGQVESPDDSIFISMEVDMARRLQLDVGDELVVDVQGLPMTTYLGSLREVDWGRRMQPNFMLLFPRGVLEEAPQIAAVVTRTPSPESSAGLQRALVSAYPNISVFDLTQLLKTVDTLLGKIAFIIRFMALFSILTGFIVLIAAVITTRFQKIRESVLLRTLGAQKKQIRLIMILEYFYLGIMAAATGLILALAGGWALTYFVFDAVFVPALLPLLLIFLSVVGSTILLGMLNSRGIANRPPLEILRFEGQ